MENLARYIIRAFFPQERMTYDREAAEMVYRSKSGSEVKMFDAQEWPRYKTAGCKHSRRCAATCQTRPSRWFATEGITFQLDSIRFL